MSNKYLQDFALLEIEHLKDLILSESDRQISKWGLQNRTPFEWMTYLTEEVGELANAISENYYRGGTSEDVVKEGIQVVTLTLKIIENYLLTIK